MWLDYKAVWTGAISSGKGKKNIFSLHLSSLAGLFWSSYGSIHGIKQLALDEQKRNRPSALFSSPTPTPSIYLRHVHPNIQMYRWKLAHLHLFLHERREEWLLITRKFHICMMSRNTFDTSRAILMKTCPTFLHLHSKKNNLYESTAVWLDPLHTAGVPGIPERGEWNENTGLIKQIKFLFFFFCWKKIF